MNLYKKDNKINKMYNYIENNPWTILVVCSITSFTIIFLNW